MTLAEKMVDFELRMTVHVHPVPLANVCVDDEGAIIILVRIVDRLGDVVLRERRVGHVRELADGNVADVGFRFVVFLCVLLHRRQFRHLCLCLVLTVIVLPIFAARRVGPHRAIGPDMRSRRCRRQLTTKSLVIISIRAINYT